MVTGMKIEELLQQFPQVQPVPKLLGTRPNLELNKYLSSNRCCSRLLPGATLSTSYFP